METERTWGHLRRWDNQKTGINLDDEMPVFKRWICQNIDEMLEEATRRQYEEQ